MHTRPGPKIGDNGCGAVFDKVTVAEVDAVIPFASVTVTVYVPAKRFVRFIIVEPLLHWYA
jgi:hypothetical protein